MEQNTIFTSTYYILKKAEEKASSCRFKVSDDGIQWKDITWGEFFASASKTYHYLSRSSGISAGTKIAIFANTRVEWAYADMAIRLCYGVFVPVYFSNTPAQAAYIINHSDSEILFTELLQLQKVLKIWKEIPGIKKVILFDNVTSIETELEKFNQHSPEKLTLKEVTERLVFLDEVYKLGEEIMEKNPIDINRTAQTIRHGDPAAIIYTSGTTGMPKGVMLTHENLEKNAEDWIKTLNNLMPHKRIDLLWLPTSHIFGWGELGLGNVLDFVTYFATSRNVLSLMPFVKPTIFMSVPAYWEKLYLESKLASTNKEDQFQKLRELTGGQLSFCLSGGAGLERELKEFFYEAGLLIIEGYGLTECSPTLTMNSKDDFDFDTVGKPFPRVQLTIAEDGEILAKGPNIFQGYYKDAEATKEAFNKDGWFKTGDIGEWTELGFLKIKGRKKEIIVTSGGKNIAPQLIEAMFKEDQYIEHIVLYGNEKKYITALVTLKENAVNDYAKFHGIAFNNYKDLIDSQEIHQLIQSRIDLVNNDLASFETIKKFYISEAHLTVEAGFITPSLKLRRNIIYEKFQNELERLYDVS